MQDDSDWAIVLAGGDGTRLRELTTEADGTSIPKQYCSLSGSRTLLGDTLARARGIVAASRIIVIVAAQHRVYWERELADLPRENVLVQPQNRGTAAGLLWPLLTIARRDPEARVAVLPADHHVGDEEVLRTTFREAQKQADRDPQTVTLLGITPSRPETDYGWIVPSRACPGRVTYFVEKPAPSVASDLMGLGGLWNGFLVVARAKALVERFEARLPELTSSLRSVFALPRGARPLALERLYDNLPAADVARDVLEGSESHLRVLRVPPCGWTDLGTPQRVAECIHDLPIPRIPRPGLRPGADLRLALAGRVASGLQSA